MCAIKTKRLSNISDGEVPQPSSKLAAPSLVAMAMLSGTQRDKGQETTKELSFPAFLCLFLILIVVASHNAASASMLLNYIDYCMIPELPSITP